MMRRNSIIIRGEKRRRDGIAVANNTEDYNTCYPSNMSNNCFYMMIIGTGNMYLSVYNNFNDVGNPPMMMVFQLGSKSKSCNNTEGGRQW